MVGLPVGQSEYKLTYTVLPTPPFNWIRIDSLLIGKKKLDYDGNGNPVSLYDFINNPATGYLSLKENYSYYPNGKLREIHHRDGTSTTYLWAYNYQYPIAEIRNATYSQVTAKISESTLSTIATRKIPTSSDLMTINNLRTQVPGAQVTTYTYRPLVGTISMTDPRGVTTLYDYDEFGRLKEAYYYEDGDTSKKRIVETYDYHYRN